MTEAESIAGSSLLQRDDLPEADWFGGSEIGDRGLIAGGDDPVFGAAPACEDLNRVLSEIGTSDFVALSIGQSEFHAQATGGRSDIRSVIFVFATEDDALDAAEEIAFEGIVVGECVASQYLPLGNEFETIAAERSTPASPPGGLGSDRVDLVLMVDTNEIETWYERHLFLRDQAVAIVIATEFDQELLDGGVFKLVLAVEERLEAALDRIGK